MEYKVIKNKHFKKSDSFSDIVKHLVRPYIPISKDEYDEIVEKAELLNSDFVEMNGEIYTFGNADGGYALMPYKNITNTIIKECIDELYHNKVRKYVNAVDEMLGRVGLIYLALEEMNSHGKFVYPVTYKYRKELTNYYLSNIKKRAKWWRKKHL